MTSRTFFALAFASLLVALPFTGCGSSSETSTGAECPEASCGGPPPSRCADGSAPTLKCVRSASGTCGWQINCPPVDASTDGADASDVGAEATPDVPVVSDVPEVSDAVDAPACPTSRPTRLSTCATIDQVCFYPCGVVMRCTKSGWDFDTTIDGGPPCP